MALSAAPARRAQWNSEGVAGKQREELSAVQRKSMSGCIVDAHIGARRPPLCTGCRN